MTEIFSYVSSEDPDSKAYKINEDGIEEWHYYHDDYRQNSMAVDSDGNIYFGGRRIIKVDSSGTKVWEKSAPDTIMDIKVDTNGNVYATDVDNYVRKILPNGTEDWAHLFSSGSATEIAIDTSGNIYVVVESLGLYKMQPDEYITWTWTGDIDRTEEVEVDQNGHVFVSGWYDWDDILYCLDATNATIDWQETMNNGNANNTEDIQVDASGYLYYSVVHLLKKFDLSTRLEVWSYNTGDYTHEVAVDYKGNVYVGNENSKFFKIDKDGDKVWEFDTLAGSSYCEAVAADPGKYSAGFWATLPPVAIKEVSNIKATELTANGEVEYLEGVSCVERGFVYDTASHSGPGDVSPAVSAYSSVINETGTFDLGNYSLIISSLTEGTTYYMRAYTEDSGGAYKYSEKEISFVAGQDSEFDTTIIEFDEGSYTNVLSKNNNLELIATNWQDVDVANWCSNSGWSSACNYDLHVERVQFNGIDNEVYTCPGPYVDFTDIISDPLIKGNSYIMTIDIPSVYAQKVTACFDWSGNGTFDETIQIGSDADGVQFSKSITIPLTASTTASIMRIISDNQVYKNACETSGYHTVADYSICIGERAYETSGTYESGTFSTEDLNDIGAGEISWNATLNGQTITVSTNVSTDAGATWKGWNVISSSGDSIPDITDIATPSDGLVKYKIEFSSDGTATPVIHDVTMIAFYSGGVVIPPIITVTNYTKDTISDEVGYQTSTVTFESDQDLVEWEARADGTGHGSGTLVGSGGAVTADTPVQFDVDYTELIGGDKTYQINVYGKNSDGAWNDD